MELILNNLRSYSLFPLHSYGIFLQIHNLKWNILSGVLSNAIFSTKINFPVCIYRWTGYLFFYLRVVFISSFLFSHKILLMISMREFYFRTFKSLMLAFRWLKHWLSQCTKKLHFWQFNTFETTTDVTIKVIQCLLMTYKMKEKTVQLSYFILRFKQQCERNTSEIISQLKCHERYA